jgi:ribosomal protein S27E
MIEAVHSLQIHCRYCGAVNTVKHDTFEKRCEKCGEVIVSALLKEEPKLTSTAPDGTRDVLRVRCPHCQFRNELPELHIVFVFLCHECGEPIAVDEAE